MSWLTPLRFRRAKRIVVNVPANRRGTNTGRRGTPITYGGLIYPSFAACARANGISKAVICWRMLRK